MKLKLVSLNCLVVSLLFCISAFSGHAQEIAPSMVWEKLYSDSICRAFAVVQTADGGYMLGGNGYATKSVGGEDCILVKVSSQGEIQWERFYGGTGIDLIRAMDQTADGGYIFAAWSSSPPSGNKESPHYGAEDAWIVKVDAAGNKQWERSFGSTEIEYVVSIQQTTDGGYIFAGAKQGDGWLLKLDGAGNKEWERLIGGEHNDFFDSFVQLDGDHVLAGSSYTPASGNGTTPHFGGSDAWLIKVDAEGELKWERVFGGLDYDTVASIDRSADGGFILGGESGSPVSGNKESPLIGEHDYWLVKVDAAGNKEWDRSYGWATRSFERIQVVRQAVDQGYVFGGYAGGRSKFVKVDARGDLEWEQYLGAATGFYTVQIYELQRTLDGGYILTGSFDYPAALPVPSACNWGAWAAKFETILSRGSDVITWEAGDGVVLESVDDLNGEWEADQSEIRTIGGANTIAFTPSGESRYYRLRGSSDLLSFGTLLSWPTSINHVLEYSSNNGVEWVGFAGEEGTIGETRYAIVPESMKEHYFRTRKAN